MRIVQGQGQARGAEALLSAGGALVRGARPASTPRSASANPGRQGSSSWAPIKIRNRLALAVHSTATRFGFILSKVYHCIEELFLLRHNLKEYIKYK